MFGCLGAFSMLRIYCVRQSKAAGFNPGKRCGKSLLRFRWRTGRNGTFFVVVYTLSAQRFILDNLDAVIACNNAAKDKNTQAEESYG